MTPPTVKVEKEIKRVRFKRTTPDGEEKGGMATHRAAFIDVEFTLASGARESISFKITSKGHVYDSRNKRKKDVGFDHLRDELQRLLGDGWIDTFHEALEKAGYMPDQEDE